ncbi:hypothetical protein [Dickeya oryzae]|uniref:hypothetical protein n=1 Tax=Dickeya oryzae TaxID=1240404 RepID=UPI00057764D4|nr:hypothetical protein [Dickeya oryzae]
MPKKSNKGLYIQCTRCRHKHYESNRKEKRDPKYKGSLRVYNSVCPRCGCKSYYDLTPQFAWCWASGLIETGDALPANDADGSGVIQIASGPKYALRTWLEVVARHGKGNSEGKLLVPGIPEASDSDKALEALQTWLKWCAPRVPIEITVVKS